jgi:hypothetical protein
MTKEELIRNLKYTMEKHRNDKVDTFGTNISLMCKDVLDYLEQPTSDDCVSRAEVHKLICKNNDKYGYSDRFHEFTEDVKALPPVTPTHGNCKDCKHIYCEHHEDTCDIDEYNPNFYCADFEKRGSENDSN